MSAEYGFNFIECPGGKWVKYIFKDYSFFLKLRIVLEDIQIFGGDSMSLNYYSFNNIEES